MIISRASHTTHTHLQGGWPCIRTYILTTFTNLSSVWVVNNCLRTGRITKHTASVQGALYQHADKHTNYIKYPITSHAIILHMLHTYRQHIIILLGTTQPLYHTAFIPHSLYTTQPLYHTAFIPHSLYTTQPLYHTQNDKHECMLNIDLLMLEELL